MRDQNDRSCVRTRNKCEQEISADPKIFKVSNKILFNYTYTQLHIFLKLFILTRIDSAEEYSESGEREDTSPRKNDNIVTRAAQM